MVNERWKLGLVLALTASILWGVLPIALDIALEVLDAYTLTWYRFTTAGIALAALLAATNNLPAVKSFTHRVWLLLIVALACLSGNYVLYVTGLSYTSPSVAQTVGQIGPMFLLLGGLLVFKERFSRLQWIGFGILLAGLLLFFNNRLPELMHPSGGFGLGIALFVAASLIWAVYGLAQKRLLGWLGAQQILMLLYIGAAVVLFPWATLGEVRNVNRLQLWMLVFCCVNTLAAYGAFAEGLKHWDVSRFGAVLATSPLFTVLAMWILERFAPYLVMPEHLNPLSLIGTALVVLGSALCALGRSFG